MFTHMQQPHVGRLAGRAVPRDKRYGVDAPPQRARRRTWTLSSPGSQISESLPTARGSFGLPLRVRGRARTLAAAMPLCLLVTFWPAALDTHSAQANTKPRHRSHRAHRFRHRSQASRPSAAGLVKYRLDAGSYFDPYSGKTAWIKAHIARNRGYAPFADRYTSIVPTLSYHDGYTTWGPHSLNPTHRAEWVAWVKRDHEHGYAGTFLDDFEAEGSGQHELGTNAELQALIEAIRAAIPNDVIEINMQPQDLCNHLGQPWLKRVLSLVDQEDIELGPYSFLPWTQLISCIQTLHSKGVHVDLVHATQGDAYSLATYLLINTGQDYIGAHMTPAEWTGYFDRDLGQATSGIEVSGSTYTRHFTGGVVSVNTSTKTGSVTG